MPIAFVAPLQRPMTAFTRTRPKSLLADVQPVAHTRYDFGKAAQHIYSSDNIMYNAIHISIESRSMTKCPSTAIKTGPEVKLVQ